MQPVWCPQSYCLLGSLDCFAGWSGVRNVGLFGSVFLDCEMLFRGLLNDVLNLKKFVEGKCLIGMIGLFVWRNVSHNESDVVILCRLRRRRRCRGGDLERS